MKHIEGGLEQVPGFSFSAIECGIRYQNRLDYALIYSEKPCNAAGVFTANRIAAAPVKLCRERIKNPIHAILINSTNANACTGDEGYRSASELAGDVAARLGIPGNSVLMASTGIIGRQLPLRKMMETHDRLLSALKRENGSLVPRAIMTTDTVPKYDCVSFTTSLGEFRIAGTAKGAGMIAPNMATLLAFLITDAPVPAKYLDASFRRAIGKTLNAITIDGDMSTNDSAILLSPRTGMQLRIRDDLACFEESLTAVLSSLAEKLVSDGEGATKVVTVAVKGAKSGNDARRIAKSVSESLLVKTALFGNDPNWGRIAAAAGYSGAAVEEDFLSISYDDLPLLIRGRPAEFDAVAMKRIIEKKSFTITVDVGIGSGAASMMTTDLSYDYVKINAEYST